MSAEANKVAMGRFFEEVYNQGDVGLFDELAAPDFLSHDRGNPTHDRAGVKQTVGAIRAAFPDVRFTADDILADGDKVVARFTMRGTQRGDFMGFPATIKVDRRYRDRHRAIQQRQGRRALARVERHGVATQLGVM
jgi:predicted ester cyclase